MDFKPERTLMPCVITLVLVTIYRRWFGKVLKSDLRRTNVWIFGWSIQRAVQLLSILCMLFDKATSVITCLVWWNSPTWRKANLANNLRWVSFSFDNWVLSLLTRSMAKLSFLMLKDYWTGINPVPFESWPFRTFKEAISRYSENVCLFVWRQTTAATRHARGNPWAICVGLHALIVAKAAKHVVATFFKPSLQLQGSQVAVSSFADRYRELVDSLSATKLRPVLTEQLASEFVTHHQKIIFVKWKAAFCLGMLAFFFSSGLESSCL